MEPARSDTTSTTTESLSVRESSPLLKNMQYKRITMKNSLQRSSNLVRLLRILVIVTIMMSSSSVVHWVLNRFAVKDETTTDFKTLTSFLVGFSTKIKTIKFSQNILSELPSSEKASSTFCSNKTSCQLFHRNKIRVFESINGFPSFWNYQGRPINVSYDSRAIKLNGHRVVLLGGSMHPSRATKFTWEKALDEAVHQGLNLITIYVMWAAHQPTKNSPLDWRLQHNKSCSNVLSGSSSTSCDWDLAQAIRAVANRGMFVHIRVGPYVCAEYSYGGIPEWLPLSNANMTMRRLNKEWMDAMEGFVSATIEYLKENLLFAHQGGPIILGQIENELGDDMEINQSDNLLLVYNNGKFILTDADTRQEEMNGQIHVGTLQDYADWCGSLVENLLPEIIWTMCNGLSAQNTIETYNGFLDDVSWLTNYGDSHRIQLDQPAMWTEHEGGFQIWGETADNPTDYVWGFTARSMTFTALRWFARGGTHLNFYMWWGGYNRGRSAAAGIMNLYASDAAMCPSGDRRQPKYGHFQKLLRMIRDIAPILLESPTALEKQQRLYTMKDDGTWTLGTDQLMFTYSTKYNRQNVSFIENASNVSCVVRLPKTLSDHNCEPKTLFLMEYSGAILVDGDVVFYTGEVDVESKKYTRRLQNDVSDLFDWMVWPEIVGAENVDSFHTNIPVEQTIMNTMVDVFSDYAWYETDFYLDKLEDSPVLGIETQEANGFLVFIDGLYVNSDDTHGHFERNRTLTLNLGKIEKGYHRLALLSESLGYINLIGRWGSSTKAKKKGITGKVTLALTGQNVSLIDGYRQWASLAGLHGERTLKPPDEQLNGGVNEGKQSFPSVTSPTWSMALFMKPKYDHERQNLYIDMTCGRGHVWLNGIDLGRYWNITRDDGKSSSMNSVYSQRYYLIPYDYLHINDNEINQLLIFDVFGCNHNVTTKLILSWIEPSETDIMEDEVDFPNACI